MTLRLSLFGSSLLVGATFLASGCSSDSGSATTSPEGGAGEAGTGTGTGATPATGSGGSGQVGQGGSPSGTGNSSGSGNASSGTGGGAGASMGSGGSGGALGDGGTMGAGGRRGRGGTAGASGGSSSSAGGTTSSTGGSAGAGTGGSAGGSPSGWLHTKGNKIYQTTGGTDSVWMGRGVNVDDVFLCGYNSGLSTNMPDQTVKTLISTLMSGWKPNFLRISLSMQSYSTTVSFLSNPAQYKTPMTNVINAIGTYPGAYVLVTLRSDASMIGQFQASDPEATGLPSDSTTTPDKAKFPNGTDPVYQALVDTFANSSFVMFGLTNEPGGNGLTDQKIASAMSHAVSVIRAEEDKLKTPHHIISVQGNSWTSNISYYANNPIASDNVVYEVHGYPPATNSYTYAALPVIIGEYGSLSNSATFYSDLESKQIPNLAWDFDPYSNCAPDLVNVNQSSTNIVASSWGNTVKSYLLMHAP